MAERARNLRKALSKSKATKEKDPNGPTPITVPPSGAPNNLNNAEVDPLQFLEVSNNLSELKQKEDLKSK